MASKFEVFYSKIQELTKTPMRSITRIGNNVKNFASQQPAEEKQRNLTPPQTSVKDNLFSMFTVVGYLLCTKVFHAQKNPGREPPSSKKKSPIYKFDSGISSKSNFNDVNANRKNVDVPWWHFSKPFNLNLPSPNFPRYRFTGCKVFEIF